MASARESAKVVQSLAEDVGEGAAGVVAAELHSRATKAIRGANSTDKSNPDESALHQTLVSSSAGIGKLIAHIGAVGFNKAFIQIVKRMGAHVCDQCGKGQLYDYMTCSNITCAQDDIKNNKEGGYDLCYECYEGHKAGKSKHDPSHQFVEHINGMFVLRMLGLLVMFLMGIQFVLNRIF